MSIPRPPSPIPHLIALDLDGTLLRSDHSISERTQQALKRLQAQGVRFVICTGRPARTAKPIIEALELGDLVALYNGAVVYDFVNNQELKLFGLPKDKAIESIQTMRNYIPEAMAAMETARGWYAEADYYAFRKLKSELLLEPAGIGDLEGFMAEGIIKLLFRHKTLTSDRLAEALQEVDVHCTWSFSSLLEVSDKGVTKENALKWIAGELTLEAKDVAAFGDQHNDKEMLAWAGFGVAMGNAVPEVKAAAGYITTSNDEDGVAEVLEGWL